MFLFQGGCLAPQTKSWRCPTSPGPQPCQTRNSTVSSFSQWGGSQKRVPGSTEGYINTKVCVLMQGCSSSLLVNRICDMGYVHPVFPTSAAKLFWRTTETRHHPPGQPRHPSSKQNALMPSRVANTRVEPCSLTSLLSGPMNTHLMLTVCLQDRL